MRTLAALLAVVLAFLAPATGLAEPHDAAPLTDTSPGWDARTMGNRLAGPGDEHGPRVVDGLLACSPGGRVEVHDGAVTCDYAPQSSPARCSSDADCALFDRLVRGVVSDGRP